MLSKSEIIARARDLGFEDVGFTGPEPFDSQREILLSRSEEYAWAHEKGLDLIGGTDPKNIYPSCQSIIVLVEAYFRQAFPPSMEGKFGRCYLDDDRVTRDGLSRRIKDFRTFLKEDGIDSKAPFNLPHRLAAARAGLGTFGRNCLIYSSRAARRSSFILPVAVLVSRSFEPDQPTMAGGCPAWCKNTCLVACPTGALKGSRKIDPRRCISYLTYYGEGITPLEMREPMGMWIYGCDRCQNVCPRNAAWMAQDLPVNPRAAVKSADFDLKRLLHMDKEYFEKKIWPHMFYMSSSDIWRWKMNVSRVMGNSLDPAYIPDLIKAFNESTDDRVRGMAAWALGRIGGEDAKKALADFLTISQGQVREEVREALRQI
ncbi:MAG: PBS lyase [Peptococcaceae bacterium BICA1-7]|nr:MAG: PBS lyase [Peptococcaceae bacterium BICA1-7]HBV97967.1 epoxyqueuosine reductase [Desulfotomaculum sp.]